MSNGRSPRFEPQLPPQINSSKSEDGPKKGNISPLSSIVGPNNMILVWTGLAIVAFVLFVIFYIVFNPPVTTSINHNNTHTHELDIVNEVINSPHNIDAV